MYHNVGSFDRLLRTAIGIILLAVGATMFEPGVIMFVFYLVGLVLIMTAMVGWCPCYSMFGKSTRRVGIEKISKRQIAAAVKEHKIDVKKPASKKKAPKKKASTKKKVETKKTTKKKSVSKKN